MSALVGREAEELRMGLERLIREAQRTGRRVQASALQRLLDDVDARDSLAFLERTNEVVIRADERAKVLAEVRAMLDRAGGAT